MNLSKREIGLLLIEVCIIGFCVFGLFGKNQSWDWSENMFSEAVTSDDGTTSSVSSTDVTLQPGVYLVSLSYETEDDMINAWSVKADDASYGGLKANACMLYSGLNKADMYIWLSETDSIYVTVTTTSGSQVTVHGASIEQTNAGFRMALVGFLAFFVIIDLLYGRNKKRPFTTTEKRTGFILFLIIISASIPLLNGYEIAGADTIYHLLRIEGIKDGLLAGQFPVRIQPNWLQGYGYATSIFYCDTFLYLPALLRIIGFPVGTCFLFYKFLVNVATVLIAFFSFQKIFRDKFAGLLGTALYTLNIYRLLIFYLKDHLGEYTAMAFLPLLAYAIWCLLQQDVATQKYRRTWIPFTIAVTCLIQCHVLSCEMAGITTIMILLFYSRRTFRKATLFELGKMSVAVVGLNLWFIVPFLDYLKNESLIITGSDVYTRTIQSHGASWAMLLGLIQVAGHSDNDISGGMQNEMPFTLGAALLLSMVYLLYLYLHRRKMRKNRILNQDFLIAESIDNQNRWHLALIGLLGGSITLCMASAVFPWDAIQNTGGIVQRLVSALQYPTRWLEIAAIFFTLVSCAVFMIGRTMTSSKSVITYTGVTIAVLIVAVGLFFSELILTSGIYKIYEEDAMGNSYLSGKEYLPEGCDETLLKAGLVTCSDNVTVASYEKNNLEVSFDFENTSDSEGYVEVPLLYYKGYEAYDTSDKTKLVVQDGTNHVVRIKIPDNASGHIYVKFVSPFSWRAAEWISYFSLFLFIGLLREIYFVREKKKGNR